MIAVILDVVRAIWLHALLGTALSLVGCGLGWSIGQNSSLSLVRLTGWWVQKIVHPLFACRSWWRRAAIIFFNNTAMMSILVVCGRWRPAGLVAVAWFGVSLGIAFRRLEELTADPMSATLDPQSAGQRRVFVGVLLNLLEPPAIMLAIGLSLGWQSVPLTSMQICVTFVGLVIPLALLAAGGEALWLGARRKKNGGESTDGRSDVPVEPKRDPEDA